MPVEHFQRKRTQGKNLAMLGTGDINNLTDQAKANIRVAVCRINRGVVNNNIIAAGPNKSNFANAPPITVRGYALAIGKQNIFYIVCHYIFPHAQQYNMGNLPNQ